MLHVILEELEWEAVEGTILWGFFNHQFHLGMDSDFYERYPDFDLDFYG